MLSTEDTTGHGYYLLKIALCTDDCYTEDITDYVLSTEDITMDVKYGMPSRR